MTLGVSYSFPRTLTFLHSCRWGLWLSVEMIREESGQHVMLGAKGIDRVWVGELSVHFLQVGTEAEGNPCLFGRLQSLL